MTEADIPDDATELTDLPRIGPELADRLRASGFESVEDVAEATPTELAEVEGIGGKSARIILGIEDVQSGRPDMLDEYRDDILEAASRGLTYEGIARVAGIGVSTLYNWMDKYPKFSEALKRARAEAEKDLIRSCSPEFVLERSYGYHKKTEVEANVDADVSVDAAENVTADFVTYDDEDE